MPEYYTFEFTIVIIPSLTYTINQTYEFYLPIRAIPSMEVTASKYINLDSLVPEKFREAVIFKDYLAAVGFYVGTWLSKIDDMQYLLDPYTVSDELKVSIDGQPYTIDQEYVSRLAALIGLTIRKNDGDTIEDFRRQLTQAIDWYKLKGSYKAMTNSIYLAGQKINVKDMYTNDYLTFLLTDWFVADYPGENPPGLDSSYYKSAHFGLEILLDQMYSIPGGYPYLWREQDATTKFADIQGYVEQIRPANTVPHYIIKTVGGCYENGVMQTTSYGVACRRIYEPWIFTRYYFDQAYQDPLAAWNLDTSKFFDYTNNSFLASVNHWKLGTGNRWVTPDTSGWDVQTPVLSGTLPVQLIRLYADRTEYEVVVDPSVAQNGISELGLYLPDTTTLVIGCTFPTIDKTVGSELRIVIILYK